MLTFSNLPISVLLGSSDHLTEGQVWSTLRAKLAALHDAQAKATETTHLVNDLQARWDDMEEALAQQADQDLIDDDQDDERRGLSDKLLEALDRLHEDSERESRCVDSDALPAGLPVD